MIPLTRAIPKCIRGALRQCAIQIIDVYFTYFTLSKGIVEKTFDILLPFLATKSNVFASTKSFERCFDIVAGLDGA